MADDVVTAPAVEPPLINRTGRAAIVLFLMAFGVGIVVWMLLKGQPNNSLHQSGLGWGFVLIILCMGGIGLGGVLTSLMPLITAPKK